MADKKIDLSMAAYEIFLEKGYKNTNISDVTKKAGMAVGSFYNYYKSKEELFLDIFIKENNRVKNELINSINWNDEPNKIIESVFNYLSVAIINNNILSEWNKPDVSNMLHEYYQTEKGKSDYNFYQFIKKLLNEKLEKENFSKERIDQIVKIFDFIYYIDCNSSNKNFSDYDQTLKILIKYFIKGIFS